MYIHVHLVFSVHMHKYTLFGVMHQVNSMQQFNAIADVMVVVRIAIVMRSQCYHEV